MDRGGTQHDRPDAPAPAAGGRGALSAPAGSQRSRILAALEEMHRRYAHPCGGTLADYIPELARANPDWFGICVATADGHIYEIGDYLTPFTIQSISKPFVYGMALEEHGREHVLSKVGVEPTGEGFDSIIRLDAAHRPHNPCVNAGAIATTGMLRGQGPTERLNRVLDKIGLLAGRELRVDVSVFVSERTHGHRNRAIAYLMLNFGMIEDNVDEILDLYFQQCSITITCRDLAVMGATLAAGGVNPLTRRRAIEPQYLRDVLTVMYTCGMYDYAGEWAYTVGLPAKSAVSGGILCVVPGRLGIAVFSPPLDDKGNSVRGIHVCEDLSREFGMHLFDDLTSFTPGRPAPALFARRPDADPPEAFGDAASPRDDLHAPAASHEAPREQARQRGRDNGREPRGAPDPEGGA